MVSLNRVELIGNVGASPEIRYANPDSPIARFSLATSSAWKNAAGERQEETTWHSLVAFGQIAKTVETYVTKGRLLWIDGRIQISTYETKDGEQRKRFEIIVRELKLFPQFAKAAEATASTGPDSPAARDFDSDLTPEYIAQQLAAEGSSAAPAKKGTSPKKRR